MTWHAFLYLTPYLISAILSGSIAFYAWQRRRVTGAIPFSVIALAQTLWTLGFIFELLSDTLTIKIFWDNLQFIPGFVWALAFLAFAWQYAGHQSSRYKRPFWWLAIPFVIFLLLMSTDSLHGLTRTSIQLIPGAPFAELNYDFTVSVWAVSLYGYALLLFGLFILVKRLIYPHRLYRGQIITIIIGAFIPMAGTILTLLNLAPTFHRDMTPYTFGLSNLVIAWGLFRYHLFDIAPIARHTLIENLPAPVFVFDLQYRLVDLNPAAQALTGQHSTTLIGQPAGEVLAAWPGLIGQLAQDEARTEIILTISDQQRHFDVNLSPVYDRRKCLTGRLLVLHDVTARRQIEEAYRAAVDHSLQGLLIIQDGQTVFANPRLAEMYGYSIEALQAMSVVEIIDQMVRPNDRAMLHQRHQKRLVGEPEPPQYEFRSIHRNGATIWVEAYVTFITYRGRSALQMVLMDITERKQVEMTLREREERLRSTLASMDDLVFTLDEQGVFLDYYQPATKSELYLRPEEFVGQPFRKVLPPVIAEQLATALNRLKATHQVEQFEYPLDIQGERHWFIANVSLRRDSQGQYAGVTIVARNTTRYKQIEAALRLSEERYRAVVETQTEIISRHRADGSFIFANEAYCRFFDKTLEELLSQSWQPVAVADDIPETQRQLAHLSPNQPMVIIENRVYSGSGDIRWMQFINQAFFDEQGQITEFQAVGRDITDRKKVETALREAKERAEAANQAKSSFLATVSHELRTPLNGILGYAQFLQGKPNLSELQANALRIIEQSGWYLLNLINDILDIAKVEAGRMELVEADFELPALLRTVGDMMHLRATEKGLAFWLETDNLPQAVQGDEQRLRQVLTNLLGNAIKFTHQGQVTLKVRPVGELHLIRFEVSDTGVGIAREDQQAIFEPFHQAGGHQQNISGTGLGLAISRNLIELMRGQLQVKSESGQGSTFWFEIPLPVVTASPEEILPHWRHIEGIQGQPPHLLIIDDDPNSRAVLVDWLTPLGFTIAEADDGHAGLQQAKTHPPAAIITDLLMPRMDGYTFTRRLRETTSIRDAVVIATSADVYKESYAQSRAAGCDAFLPKPIKMEALLGILETYLAISWRYHQHPRDKSTPDLMISPPRHVLDRIRESVLIGDIREIRHLLYDLAEREPHQFFVKKAQTLVQHFQINELQKLLEMYLNDDPNDTRS